MTVSETKTITELLNDDGARAALFEDAEKVLDRRVAASRGVTGMAVRAGYAAFQRVQPGIVRAALARLAPHFAPPMDDHWQRAIATDDRAEYFTHHAPAVAADLLAVTDALAKKAANPVLASIYRSLRGRAQQEVAAAMPDVARLLLRHLG